MSRTVSPGRELQAGKIWLGCIARFLGLRGNIGLKFIMRFWGRERKIKSGKLLVYSMAAVKIIHRR